MIPKIKTRKQLNRILTSLRSKDKRVVFTNGCFEVIHTGHIRCLTRAKKSGDILVVAVNSDSSVRRLKGKNRPVVCEKDRMEIVAALECVDYVVLFREDTPGEIIEYLKPDILVKGADYKLHEIVGRKTMKRYGGKVKTIPLVKNKSTTRLIKHICQTYTG